MCIKITNYFITGFLTHTHTIYSNPFRNTQAHRHECISHPLLVRPHDQDREQSRDAGQISMLRTVQTSSIGG